MKNLGSPDPAKVVRLPSHYLVVRVIDAVAGELTSRMRQEGIADPLAAEITLSSVLADLYTIAGGDLPAEIAERVG